MLKKIVLGSIGVVLVLAGVTLIFKNWVFIQMIYRGCVGPVLAVIGLVCLTMIKDRS